MGNNSRREVRIAVPVAAMRELATDDSQVVSQALFSEQAYLLDKVRGWVKIETAVDGYRGWVRKESCIPFKPSDRTSVKVVRPAVHLYSVKDTVYGPILTLPFESQLELPSDVAQEDPRWLEVVLPTGRHAFVQRGDVSTDHRLLSLEETCRLSHQFLGLPYTWGGRSSFGYDCSGYVQMLYRQMGHRLPRDSKDQCRWHNFVDVPIEKTTPGNLIFFGANQDKITHVGFCLGNDQFIHATVSENMPYLRVSSLQDPHWSSGHRAAKALK